MMFTLGFVLGFVFCYFLMRNQKPKVYADEQPSPSISINSSVPPLNSQLPVQPAASKTSLLSRDILGVKKMPVLWFFYLGAFLLIAAGFGFIAFSVKYSASALEPIIMLVLLTLGFLVVGKSLVNHQRLAPAGITYLAIGLLFIPLDGIAFYDLYAYVFMSAGQVALITSLIFLTASVLSYAFVWRHYSLWQLMILGLLSSCLSLVNLSLGSDTLSYYLLAGVILGYIVYLFSWYQQSTSLPARQMLAFNTYALIGGGCFLGVSTNFVTIAENLITKTTRVCVATSLGQLFTLRPKESAFLLLFLLLATGFFAIKFFLERLDIDWLLAVIGTWFWCRSFLFLLACHQSYLWAGVFILVSMAVVGIKFAPNLADFCRSQRYLWLEQVSFFSLFLSWLYLIIYYFFTQQSFLLAVPWFFYGATLLIFVLKQLAKPDSFWQLVSFFWTMIIIFVLVFKVDFAAGEYHLNLATALLLNNLLALFTTLATSILLQSKTNDNQHALKRLTIYLFTSFLLNFWFYALIRFASLNKLIPWQLGLYVLTAGYFFYDGKKLFPNSHRGVQFLHGFLPVGLWLYVASYRDLEQPLYYIVPILGYIIAYCCWQKYQESATSNHVVALNVSFALLALSLQVFLLEDNFIAANVSSILSGIACLGVGYYWRSRQIKITGLLIAILAVMFHLHEQIVWWQYLAILGVGVLAVATYLLKKQEK